MVETRGRRGEYAKSAGRRQEIVAAALEVFSEAGYHKGSIRDVADRAGLSQAGVLHHYPSKTLLLQAVLDWRDEDALARMGKVPPRGLDRPVQDVHRSRRLPARLQGERVDDHRCARTWGVRLPLQHP